MNLEQHNTLPEVGRKFVFWVVYDATGDRQFVKMDSETGCLAMFDSEECAAAFASGLDGVGYREVVLYQLPPETSKKPEEGCDMSDLVKRLRIKAGMIEMGELIAWGSDSALMREAADALEMAAPAAQVEPVGYVRPHQLDALRSGKACGITLKDKPATHNRVTIPLYAAPPPAEQRPTPDVSALVAIAREIVNLHAKRKVVLTVHVEALEDALADLHQPPTKCPGIGCTDQGCPAHYASQLPRPKGRGL